jgi:tetratricopeptide (TPR) repeat protein
MGKTRNLLGAIGLVALMGTNGCGDEGWIGTGRESTFRLESGEVVTDLTAKARKYFYLAEEDFTNKRWQAAAENYRISAEAIPTAATYFNLGMALQFSSDYEGARDAYETGLSIARRKGDEVLERAFLHNIDNLNSSDEQ